MDKLYIIKIGGNIIDDETKLSSFLKSFTEVEGKKILVHGGGKLATRMAEAMGIQQQMIDGRRITDAETLKIVTMVYAGYINKNIVAQLQSIKCNAIGLCGADGNCMLAHKRVKGKASPFEKGLEEAVDYGFAGDIDFINIDLLNLLLQNNEAVVIAPITHDGKGQLLNTNADTIAQEVAKAMSKLYEVHLVYCFEKSGVLLDVNDETSVIEKITASKYEELKHPHSGGMGAISAGMIPKIDNTFVALKGGVNKVIIGKADELQQLINGTKGTSITHE